MNLGILISITMADQTAALVQLLTNATNKNNELEEAVKKMQKKCDERDKLEKALKKVLHDFKNCVDSLKVCEAEHNKIVEMVNTTLIRLVLAFPTAAWKLDTDGDIDVAFSAPLQNVDNAQPQPSFRIILNKSQKFDLYPCADGRRADLPAFKKEDLEVEGLITALAELHPKLPEALAGYVPKKSVFADFLKALAESTSIEVVYKKGDEK